MLECVYSLIPQSTKKFPEPHGIPVARQCSHYVPALSIWMDYVVLTHQISKRQACTHFSQQDYKLLIFKPGARWRRCLYVCMSVFVCPPPGYEKPLA